MILEQQLSVIVFYGFFFKNIMDYLRTIATTIYNVLSNYVMPFFCVSCRVFLLTRTVFCASCACDIVPIVSQNLRITATKSITVFAVCDYTEPLASLIRAKVSGDITASYLLGKLIWQYTNIRHVPCDVLVPIPLHWTRFAWRGYNQAEEIARSLSQEMDRPVGNLLKRIQRTQLQATLSPAERRKNVESVFEFSCKNRLYWEGKHIVLVDDLMTTGATLVQAAKILMLLKPASISAVVACRKR